MVAKNGPAASRIKSGKGMPATLSKSHPYKKYEATPEWKALWESMDDLVKNKDVTETTDRSYIVGYLVQQLRHKLR